MNRNLMLAMPLICAAVISGCNDDNNGKRQRSAEAQASLGLISNATVNFYRADGTTLIGSSDTGTAGTARINFRGYNGPVVIEVVGDDVDAMYFDEALATTVPFSSVQVLRALAPSPASVAVTPLTELAYQAAQRQGLFPITADAVNQLNEIIRAALAPGLNSILTPPTLLSSGGATLSDSEADSYALLLAALAELGDGDVSGTPALAVLNALIADLVDGLIDGQNNGSPISVPYSNFLSEMQAALSALASAYSYPGDTSAQAPVSSSVDTSEVGNPGDGENPTPSDGALACNSTDATLNSELVGSYDLVYSQNAEGGPFTDGQAVTAVVNANGSLQINGSTLTDPRFCVYNGTPHTPEIIWVNGNQIEFALTDNDLGTFNEINVGDGAAPRDFADTQLPKFLGQLRLQESGSGAPEKLLAIAGNYSPVVVKKSADMASTYTLGDSLPVTIDATTGVITVDGQYTLDPAAESFAFFDRSDNSTPRYQIEVTSGDIKLTYQAFLDGDEVVAHSLRRSNASSGAVLGSIEGEQQPLPTAVLDFFDDLQAAQPVQLQTVADDTSYSSGFDGLCTPIILTSNNGSAASNDNQSIPFQVQFTAGNTPFDEDFFRSIARFSSDENGDSLLFTDTGKTVRLRSDGYIDLEAIFLGNLKDRATNEPSALAAADCNDPELNNNGAAALTGNGVTGEVDGAAFTYASDVLIFPDNSGGNTVRLDALAEGDATSRWRLFFPNAVGNYACAETAEGTVLQHIHQGGFGPAGGSATGKGSCQIKVVQAGPIYEGYFVGVLEDGVNDPLLVVSDGYFYYDPTSAGSGNGNLPADTNGTTLDVTQAGGSYQQGDSFLLDTVASGLTRPGQMFANFSGDGFNLFQFLGLPLTIGSFDCGQVPAGQFQAVQMSMEFSFSSNNAGASCTIVIDSNSGNVYEGSYSATLINGDGASVGIAGEFRFPGPAE